MFFVGLSSTFWGKDYNSKLEETMHNLKFDKNGNISFKDLKNSSLWEKIGSFCENTETLNTIFSLDEVAQGEAVSGPAQTVSKDELKVLLRMLDRNSKADGTEIISNSKEIFDNKYDTNLEATSSDELKKIYDLTKQKTVDAQWGELKKSANGGYTIPLTINGKEIVIVVDKNKIGDLSQIVPGDRSSNNETDEQNIEKYLIYNIQDIFDRVDSKTLSDISKEIDVIRFKHIDGASGQYNELNTNVISINPSDMSLQDMATVLTHEVVHATDADAMGNFDSSKTIKNGFENLKKKLVDIGNATGTNFEKEYYLLTNELEYLAEYRGNITEKDVSHREMSDRIREEEENQLHPIISTKRPDRTSSYNKLITKLKDMLNDSQISDDTKVEIRETFALIQKLNSSCDEVMLNAENSDVNERVPEISRINYDMAINGFSKTDKINTFKLFANSSYNKEGDTFAKCNLNAVANVLQKMDMNLTPSMIKELASSDWQNIMKSIRTDENRNNNKQLFQKLDYISRVVQQYVNNNPDI